ncbi:MAG TPA: zf-HC2 domain-containing protein [Candidatus Krumholzibacteria bacterium]|nr:zf-HC2 domain-containing protein [Candidatus Krumholzibacteria bacterium]
MNDRHHTDCERFEAMIAAWFDADGLSGVERDQLTAHMASCASCRESFELSTRMEDALVSRRAQVPAAAGFLPDFEALRGRQAVVAAARSYFAHPRLVAVFRTMMSPAGVAIILVIWSALFALRFRSTIADVFAYVSSGRFEALTRDISEFLLHLSGGDAYTLTAIYVALTMIVLASTGVITLRYIRQS